MASYDPEMANNQLVELSAVLRPWYINRGSDSVRIQDLRAQEYGVAERLLEGLIRDIGPEHRVELTIGRTAVKAVEFMRGPYDISRGSPHELVSGYPLELRTITHAYNGRTEMAETYAGFIFKLPFSEIARTLTERGRLSIVEVPAEAPAKT